LEITGILRSPSEAWNHKFNLIGVSLTKPDWVVRTLERCPPEAAGIPSSQLDQHAQSVYARVTSGLPMIPTVDQTVLTSTASGVVTSTSATFVYLEDVLRLQTPVTKRYALESFSEYRQLQESHQRPEQVRTLLEETLPNAVPKFDSARKAYRQYKSGFGPESAAALSMRTFLDGLQGELFEQARHRPKENMKPDIVLERLFSSAPTRTDVEQQFAQRPTLIDELSKKAKQRDPSQVYDVDALWARVLDHAFIVANALN
jgi:hypothetical protein